MASNVSFINHDITCMMFNYMDPVHRYRERLGDIHVGNNVFIGSNSTVLYDAHIGNNVIIGAGSLVNKDIADGSVAAGVPCRVIFLGKLIKKQVEDGHGRRIFWVLIIGVPALILAIFFGVRNGGSVERFTSLFEGNFINNVTTDDSFLGRQRSIEGSFRILKDHPMGIPFSIYAIENLSSRYFTMEYPHSTLFSYILLWGPIIAIFVFVYIIRLFVRAIKLKDNSAIYLGYYIFILIFYGSPILYAKSYAFIFVILSYIKSKLDDLKQERNMELTNEENYLIR